MRYIGACLLERPTANIGRVAQVMSELKRQCLGRQRLGRVLAFWICGCLATLQAWADPSVPDAEVAGMTMADCQRDLSSQHRVVRLRAIRTLGVFDQAAADPLGEALEHDDPAVRFLAATHLGRIGGDSLDAAVASLERLAGSPEASQPVAPQPDVAGDDQPPQPQSVRMAAAYALCEAGQTERFLPILVRAISYPDRGTACYAADLIGRLGADAAAATEVLETAYANNKPAVAGGDYHVGGAAMNALRKIRGESSGQIK